MRNKSTKKVMSSLKDTNYLNVTDDGSVSYGAISWDSNDLISTKNGAWRVFDTYGLDAVMYLDGLGLFGGLDTMAALKD